MTSLIGMKRLVAAADRALQDETARTLVMEHWRMVSRRLADDSAQDKWMMENGYISRAEYRRRQLPRVRAARDAMLIVLQRATAWRAVPADMQALMSMQGGYK